MAAADRDQAKLLVNAIDTLSRLNPWLGFKVHNYLVTNPATGSFIEVIASDAGSSYGYTPDFIVCDELTHWPVRGQDMWDSLFSSAAKKASCVLIIIANAGMGQGDSWQWNVREACRESPAWYFHSLNGPQASWITEDRLEEQRELLPPSVYNRLWGNIWSTSEGDALDPADIDACITQTGPLEPRRFLEMNALGQWTFIAGLDLGIKHDHSGFVVLGLKYGSPRITLALCRSWRPQKGKQVQFSDVRAGILEAHEKYHIHKLFFDPSQALQLAQELQRDHFIVCEEMPFVGQHLNRMAASVVETFRTRSIDLYPCKELIRDLKRLVIVEKDFGGMKLEAAATVDGHADTAIALAIALPEARQRTHLSAFKHTPPTAATVLVDPQRHGVQYERPRMRRR